MARRVIAMLGAQEPKETTYVVAPGSSALAAGECTTAFASYAVHTLYRADSTVLLCTSAAMNNFEILRERHPAANDAFISVPIPEGRSAEQLWTMFDQLTAHVDPQDEVVFDISNGLRMAPIIVSSALNFLQKVRNIAVLHVVYGAYELRDVAANRTELLVLDPFLSLQRWVDAAHSFTHYGQGEELARLVGSMKLGTRNPWQRVAQAVRRISVALQLVHLKPLDQYTREFENLVAGLEFDTAKEYAPLALTLTATAEAFRLFQAGGTARDELLRQQKIMHWYTEHNMYAQAVILAKEWVDCYALYLNHPNRTDPQLLLDFSDDSKKGNIPHLEYVKLALPLTGEQRRILRELRNSTAHASLQNATNGQYDVIRVIRECTTQLIAQKITE